MKGNVSDLLELAKCIYEDATAGYSADVSDLRDLETIESRVKHEGLSFLTITLPKFCQDFERSLADGFVSSTSFREFRKAGSIPAFLHGMTSLLFDKETGRIFDEFEQSCSATCVRSMAVSSVRQICLSFKKLKIDCTLQRVQSALSSFIATEHSFQEFSLSEEDSADFSAVSSMLWHDLVYPIRVTDCVPRHGPGATAEHISGNQKYVWRNWHDRLEPYFSLVGVGYPLGTEYRSNELEMVTIIAKEQEQPVRVCPVPKTLKGPRIIAIEPCCNQYIQQGIRDVLYKGLESYWLTRGHVNFRDQSINQNLALISSKTGRLVTIDLSDASDRVPRSLALDMFSSNPDLRDAIDACRSTKAEMPDGTIIGPLNKFASMGSALCFPVEAMYFYTICVVAILKKRNLPVTLRNIFRVSRGVYVYGDDIIVPTTYADVVLEYLQKYNCKVNFHKTFVSGNFRESCGTDAYLGESVTPTYIRELCPENKRQVSELISWVATANAFYKKGYWVTTTFMFDKLERILGRLPYVSEESSALGRISYLGYQSAERWNDRLQRFEVKAWVPSPIYRTDEIGGYAALSKSLQMLEQRRESLSNISSPLPIMDQNPFMGMAMREGSEILGRYSESFTIFDSCDSRDVHQLERFALHGAVVLKRHWVPALTGRV
jgi:hypothetical protein